MIVFSILLRFGYSCKLACRILMKIINVSFSHSSCLCPLIVVADLDP